MTYIEAYEKIIQAYFKDEIEPFKPEFCFCGTLAGNSSWINRLDAFEPFRKREHNYTAIQYLKMEEALLKPLTKIGAKKEGYGRGAWCEGDCSKDNEQYESLLFAGMCAALEVLKEIHRNRGENVDNVPEFKKRVNKKLLNDLAKSD